MKKIDEVMTKALNYYNSMHMPWGLIGIFWFVDGFIKLLLVLAILQVIKMPLWVAVLFTIGIIVKFGLYVVRAIAKHGDKFKVTWVIPRTKARKVKKS